MNVAASDPLVTLILKACVILHPNITEAAVAEYVRRFRNRTIGSTTYIPPRRLTQIRPTLNRLVSGGRLGVQYFCTGDWSEERKDCGK